MNAALFSSKTDLWATPQDLFDVLHREFHFQVDVCALPENAKCPIYFTPEIDGLKQEWKPGIVHWMNSPYGPAERVCKSNCKKKTCQKRGWHNTAYRAGIDDFMKKAHASAKAGALVVCLVPARTETKWFWNYARYGEVRLLPGRLKFGDGKGTAPFPSAVIVFHPFLAKQEVLFWDYRSNGMNASRSTTANATISATISA